MTTTATTQDVLGQVEQVAALAGYTVTRHQVLNAIQINFDLGNGRKQTVFVTHIGRAANDKDVIQFMSPCMTMDKGLFKGLGKSQAIDLLKRNSTLIWGAFCVTSMGDKEGIMVCSNQLVETMDVEEFKTHANYVAIIADSYEKEHGKDLY